MKLSLKTENRSNAGNLCCYECGREEGREERRKGGKKRGRERELERCRRRQENIGDEKGERKEMRPLESNNPSWLLHKKNVQERKL